jgi:carbon starvation protein CstA
MQRRIHFDPEVEARAMVVALRRERRDIQMAVLLFSLAAASLVIWCLIIPAYYLFAIGAAITLSAAGLFCILDIPWRRLCASRGHHFVHTFTVQSVEVYECLHCREQRIVLPVRGTGS